MSLALSSMYLCSHCSSGQPLFSARLAQNKEARAFVFFPKGGALNPLSFPDANFFFPLSERNHLAPRIFQRSPNRPHRDWVFGFGTNVLPLPRPRGRVPGPQAAPGRPLHRLPPGLRVLRSPHPPGRPTGPHPSDPQADVIFLFAMPPRSTLNL